MNAPLEAKELLSAVVTCVMSNKQSERDDACRKLQGHILAVEEERNRSKTRVEWYERVLKKIRDGGFLSTEIDRALAYDPNEVNTQEKDQ